jgi:hypothetical protein
MSRRTPGQRAPGQRAQLVGVSLNGDPTLQAMSVRGMGRVVLRDGRAARKVRRGQS